MGQAPDIESALVAWRVLLGPNAVATRGERLARFTRDTSQFSQPISGVLQPAGRDSIPGLVRIANQHRVPLYPISTGRNWGYGTANPPRPDCVIVDLSELRALDFDSEMGVVTLEPGVTQASLHDFLSRNGHPFMVPVTGAGPNCSVLGNALERGFGLTPYSDHFGAVTSIEAVLANGELYRTPLTQMGAGQADRAFKWGVGPYLDGLFSQGNFGIVTRMSVALAPRPERLAVFFFTVTNEGGLEPTVEQVRALLRNCGSSIGAINLMNRARMQAMASRFGGDSKAAAGLVGSRHLPAWTGAGALYGTRSVVQALMSEVRRHLGGVTGSVRFVERTKLLRMEQRLGRLPFGFATRARQRIRQILPSLKVLMGEPSEVALPLAYLRRGDVPAEGLDPARDGCGVYWYSPLVPMIPERVRSYVRTVEKVAAQHQFATPITLTSMSDRCFDSTLPILFDARNDVEAAGAETFLRELFEAGRREGFVPYRMGSQHMGLMTRREDTFWTVVAQLKRAVDPEGILAPGRYSP